MLHMKLVTRFRIIAAVVGIWVFGILFKLTSSLILNKGKIALCLSGTGRYTDEPLKIFIGVFTIVLNFFMPVIVICISYVKMFLALKNTVRNKQYGDSSASDKRVIIITKAKVNVLKTLLSVSVGFFLCWVWSKVYYFVNIGVQRNHLTTYYNNLALVFAFMNCFINPIVYCIQYEAFQRGMMNIFRKFCKMQPQQNHPKIPQLRTVSSGQHCP